MDKDAFGSRLGGHALTVKTVPGVIRRLFCLYILNTITPTCKVL
jgi:hypothetical protein